VNLSWVVAAVGALTVLMLLAAFVLQRQLRYQRRLAARIRLSQGMAPAEAEIRLDVLKGAWGRMLAALGQVILRTGLLSARTRAELEHTLTSVGLRGLTGLEIFIGSKIASMAGLPLLAALGLRSVSVPPIVGLIALAAAALVGLLLPDMIVRFRHRRYLDRVARGLPDALDLLVICSQAGLGLTIAIARVAEEMQWGEQDIGKELAVTASELQLLADSRVALQNLGTRTGVEGLVRLGTTLVQSMQYGTPLAESMRVLSAEMRDATLTRFEGKAARLGSLLTLPMIVFILPCVFLVVGGPAAVQIYTIGK